MRTNDTVDRDSHVSITGKAAGSQLQAYDLARALLAEMRIPIPSTPIVVERRLRRRLERRVRRRLRSAGVPRRLRSRVAAIAVCLATGLMFAGRAAAATEVNVDTATEIIIDESASIAVRCGDSNTVIVSINGADVVSDFPCYLVQSMSAVQTVPSAQITVDFGLVDALSFPNTNLFSIVGGDGADDLRIACSGNVVVSAGGGNDVVTSCGASASIDAGAGTDTVIIEGSSGPDTIALLEAGEVLRAVGGAADEVEITVDIRGAERLTVDLGAGNDNMSFTWPAASSGISAVLEAVELAGGGGNDQVTVEFGDASFDLAVNGGEGGDRLAIRTDSSPESLVVDGTRLSRSDGGLAQISNFETVDLDTGDESGDIGDHLTVLAPGLPGLSVVGGLPNTLPGDTLVADPGVQYSGFEQISGGLAVPAIGRGGLLALLLGMLLAPWRALVARSGKSHD